MDATCAIEHLGHSFMQRYQKQRWLELTRRAFDHIDVDSDGKVSVDDLIKAFEDRIPAGMAPPPLTRALVVAPANPKNTMYCPHF